jgi:hypothetical protein
MCCGADSITGDRLGCWNLTIKVSGRKDGRGCSLLGLWRGTGWRWFFLGRTERFFLFLVGHVVFMCWVVLP